MFIIPAMIFRPQKLHILNIFLALTGAFLISWNVLSAKIIYTPSDPRGALVLSQAMLEETTLKLDHYTQAFSNAERLMVEKNGHVYYYFPIGTSLFSMPFVFLENIAGHDMTVFSYESQAQMRIAALLCALLFLINLRLALHFMRPVHAFIFSMVFSAGTSFMSTMGSALWSIDMAALFASLVLLHLVRVERVKDTTIKALYVGALLFSAYLTRPTMAAFAVAVLIYLYLRDRRAMLRSFITLGGLFLLFVVFSYTEFNQPLPDYYMPSRLKTETFLTALYGNLFSPGRGLFVFSPFLLFIVFLIPFFHKSIPMKQLVYVSLAWFLAHLVIVSNFPHWWGGHSFGPRLMTDVLPAFVVLGALLWEQVIVSPKKAVILATVVPLAAISIYIHAIIGLHDNWPSKWNNEPDVESYPEYVLDWRYPQFLHNRKRHVDRLLSHKASYETGNFPINEKVNFSNMDIMTYRGWHKANDDLLVSTKRTARILFTVAEIEREHDYQLVLECESVTNQKVFISFNSARVGEIALAAGDVQKISIPMSGSLFKVNAANEIGFYIPGASEVEGQKGIYIGLGLRSLAIMEQRSEQQK